MKILLAAIAFIGLAQVASAALLETEVTTGLKKVCIYSDGSTITISSVGICKLSK